MSQSQAYEQQGRSPGGPDGTVGIRTQLAQVRRFWWLVLLVVTIAVAGAVAATKLSSTTYTGRSSLVVNSPNRSPDQDAVLVQGYVDYFNDHAYQAQLVQQAGVNVTVTLEAHAAAASPILLVQATTARASDAQSAATAVAKAFQQDINSGITSQQDDQVKQIQDQIDKLGNNADPSVVATLESQIATLQQNQTNKLQQLQLEGGVQMNAPNLKKNLTLGVLGGLVLGAMGAISLGALRGPARRRRRSSHA